MTRTVVESATQTAIIGFDQPFCVIGERINPTGRKKLAAELEAGDFSTVEKDALAQVAAGANILDINAGVVYNSNPNPNETEPPLMKKMIELVQGLTDIPLCIDSSVPEALDMGLQTAKGRPLLNSVTGEEERLEFVLPLVKKYNVPVVAISNDDTGISEDPEVRFAVAKKSWNVLRILAFLPMISWSIRWSCPSVQWQQLDNKCLHWCENFVKNLGLTPPVARLTCPLDFPIGTALTMPFSPWPWVQG
jgi:cobalamin-dependent methionine synthase I